MAGMANFSSDRSILEYARHIWGIQPYPLDDDTRSEAAGPAGGGEETRETAPVSAVDAASLSL